MSRIVSCQIVYICFLWIKVCQPGNLPFSIWTSYKFIPFSLENTSNTDDEDDGLAYTQQMSKKELISRLNRLEIEHSFLKQQNAHLSKELSFARYTIQALKTIAIDKGAALEAARQELERAHFRNKMLSMTLLRQEQQQRQQEEWFFEQAQMLASTCYDPAPRAATAGYHAEHADNHYDDAVCREHDDQEPQPQLTPPESPRGVGDMLECNEHALHVPAKCSTIETL